MNNEKYLQKKLEQQLITFEVQKHKYHIYSHVRQGFPLSRMTTSNQISSVKFCCNMAQVLPFQNNLKDLDPSYKMDLDFWDCFGRKRTLY